LLGLSLAQGFTILLAIVLAFTLATIMGRNHGQTRALVFATLIFGNIFLILGNRSWTQTIFQTIFKKNPVVWWIMTSALGFLMLINFIPALNDIFRFSPLGLFDFGLAFGLGFLSIVWFEIYKLIKKFIIRKNTHPPTGGFI
jgi:P-type Ca2+ transporter type 2C